MAKKSGQAAAMLSLAGSAVQMPETKGWTSRSKASRPRRRIANDSRLSSSAGPSARPRRGGMNRSAAIRSRAGQESRGEERTPASRPGASSRKPAGTGLRQPGTPGRGSDQTRARRTAAETGTSSLSRPSRRTSAMPSGRAARKLSAERSTSQPSRAAVSTTPPSRPPASSRVTRGRLDASAPLTSHSAAARPARPPPITTKCCGVSGDRAICVARCGRRNRLSLLATPSSTIPDRFLVWTPFFPIPSVLAMSGDARWRLSACPRRYES